MKKISYVFFCFAMLAVPFFTSCDNEPLGGEFFTTPDGSDSTGEEDQTSEECTIAMEAMTSAQAAYASASAETYTAACNTYADAIDNAILVCGDNSGALTNLLNAVGDCATVNECLQATAAVAIAKTNFEAATSENVEALCFAYLETLENQIAVCGDAAGLIQDVIDSLPCDNDCDNAIAATATAQANFDAVDVMDGTAYVQACNELKASLLTQIDACGDTDGVLTARVLALGDCSPPEQPGPVRMEVDGVLKNFNTSTVSISGSTLNVLATDVDTNDTFFFRIILGQTGADKLQDSRYVESSVIFNAVEIGAGMFTSDVTENVSGSIMGTFEGNMTDDTGAIRVITNGVIEVTY